MIGDRDKFGELLALMEDFDFWFKVSPRHSLVGVQATDLAWSSATGLVCFGSHVNLASVSTNSATSRKKFDPLREPSSLDSER